MLGLGVSDSLRIEPSSTIQSTLGRGIGNVPLESDLDHLQQRDPGLFPPCYILALFSDCVSSCAGRAHSSADEAHSGLRGARAHPLL